ncbi:hypothetical protein D3C76_1550640 [compost metagenome]
MQAGFRRWLAPGGGAVGGNLNLQEIIGGQAAFVFAGFAEPAPGLVLTYGHIASGGGGPALCADPVTGINQGCELQEICHPSYLFGRNIIMV